MDDVLNTATNRVPLQFDKNGNPTYESVKSPDSFKPRALCIKPPHDVVPIIFVPGIMGTNLRVSNRPNVSAWAPPNGTLEGIGAALNGAVQTPPERQVLFDPNNTEVNPDGPCDVPEDLCWLTTDEAKQRGWGALHADSYHSVLQQLEISLNDQYSKPGHPEEQGNYLLPEIGLLTQLGEENTDPCSDSAGAPNYKKLATEASKAWNLTPPALTQEEALRLDDYYYPVWAYGYNWLKSNETSAQSLIKKIDEIVAYYQQTNYFSCEGKVILVSHSMGGLVVRRAAQLAPDKILGIVHGVQPVAGAPVVYRRFRAGTEVGGFFDLEGAAVAAIIGWNSADITPTLSCASGPLELLPTKYYPPGWLKVTQDNGKKIVFSLPVADPYEEIYSKTTDDCWWGMLDPALIDPAKKLNEGENTPIQEHRKALRQAQGFHDTLGLFAHSESYGYYGIDEKQRTFGHINWETSSSIPYDGPFPLIDQRDTDRNLTGKSTVPIYEEKESPTVKFELSNTRDQGGDGTVPIDSGKLLENLTPPPKAAFPIAGYDHQMSYNNRYAYQATIYGIAKIIQLAAPKTSF